MTFELKASYIPFNTKIPANKVESAKGEIDFAYDDVK